MNLAINVLLGIGVTLAIIGSVRVGLRGTATLAAGGWLCAASAAAYVMTTGERWVWLAAIISAVAAGITTRSVIREIRSQ